MISNDGWSSKPPVWPDDSKIRQQLVDKKEVVIETVAGWPDSQKEMNEWFKKQPSMLAPKIIGVDLASKPDQTAYGKWQDGKLTSMTEEEFRAQFQQEWPEGWNKLNNSIQKVGEEIIKQLPLVPRDLGYEIGMPTIEIRERKNKVPTHDPYTNPNALLYYSCNCGQVLDPNTKSFAGLNNAAMNAGWKIRFGSEHYIPYCPKCVVEKGIE